MTALAAALLLAVSTAAQEPQQINAPYKKSPARITRQHEPAQAVRTYAPHIKGRSSSFVVEGLITRLEKNALTIKTSRGEHYSFSLDDQTSVLGSTELVSVATMADIALNASDLHLSDHVEIVTERIGRRDVARIITLIESSGAQVAKR